MKEKGKISLGISILLILIILFSLFVVIGNLTKRSLLKKSPSLPQTTISPSSKITEEKPKEAPLKKEEIFSYEGEIVEISKKEIQLLISPLQESTEEKIVTVKVSPETQIFQTYLPAALPKGETQLMSEEISLEDLKAGDKIIVLSDINIKNKTEFKVFRIDKIIEK